MTELTPNDFALSNGLLDNPEFQLLYESLLTNEGFGTDLFSCPPLGTVQTQAETTSRTGSLKPDGVSSLPVDCRLNVEVGFQSPLETTVLDSSSPLDGIVLSNLLNAKVELTPNSLPHDMQFYSGKMGVVVDIDQPRGQIYISVQTDTTISTKICINLANSRMLRLLPPIPSDTVRIIRGNSAGAEGYVTSQPDNRSVVVKFENGSSAVFLLGDLVRLDSHSTETSQNTSTSNSSSPSNNASVEDMNKSSTSTNKNSPSFSTGWRVNSPIPSPMDPVMSNFDVSPSSSIVDSVTSPSCNQWSVSSSSDLSSLPDLSLLTDSGISSSSVNSTAITNLQQKPAQSLPTLHASQSMSNSALNFRSLQTDHYPQNNSTDLFSSTHTESGLNPAASNCNPSVSSGNLYPELTGTYNNSSFMSFNPSNNFHQSSANCQSEQVNVGTASQTGGVSYPPLPAYPPTCVPNTPSYLNSSYGQTNAGGCLSAPAINPASYMNQQQQQQFAPVYFNPASGLCYNLPQQSSMYSVMNNRPHPQMYQQSLNNRGSIGFSAQGYPSQTIPSYQPSLPFFRGASNPPPPSYSSGNHRTMPVNSFPLKPQLNSSAGVQKRTSLYPSLPSMNDSKSNDKLKKCNPWDEFKALVKRSPRNGGICRNGNNMTFDTVVERAIDSLLTKDPPHYWYNPLVKEDTSCESDLCTESVRVSALCPLTKQRMENPCRGLHCTHLQCFDARAFLKLAVKRRSQTVSNSKGQSSSSSNTDNGWKCPLCRKAVSPNQMFIEKYLKKAICNCESNELEFKGTCSWEPYENCRPPTASVIDLTMESDDEL